MKRLYRTVIVLLLVACSSVEKHDGYSLLRQNNGPELGYDSAPIITQDGRYFKDLNRNARLDPYEDWRLSPEERAADLAAQLPPEYLSGLMTNGHTVNVPGISSMSVSGITYNGMPYSESGAEPSDICDRLREALENFDTRQVLLAHSDGPETIARWNNKVQALVEALPFGIPCANSTDPRNEIKATDEYNAGSGGVCSQWPTPLGLAATFDSAAVRDFAACVKREYQALGFRTALSPQADLATEPRWRRVPGTFGENPELVSSMVRAYIDEMQPEISCIEKHWPGGGTGEGGRDAHLAIGKYGVFPGGRLAAHMDVFDLSAAGIMPYYTISYGQDPSGENVGNSYSSYMIDSLLRKKYGYEGIVCTDWGIVADYNGDPLTTGGKCYGVEDLSIGERILKALEAGVDMFGGSVKAAEIMDAWKLWCNRYGEDSARRRWESSASKNLAAMIRTGVFENPYVDVSKAVEVLSDPESFAKGEDAQVKSVVMVKNHSGVLPFPRGSKVYVPLRHIPGVYSMTGRQKKAPYEGYSVDTTEVAKYYTIVSTPEEADFALVAITEPEGGIGYKDGQYMPISLQYSPYTAIRAHKGERSYRGKTIRVENETDLGLVRDTKAAMGGKPVVVLLQTTRPVVMEFEPFADAILVAFGVRSKAFMELVSGSRESTGRLPMQFPASMDEVECQREDVPQDMTPWTDSDGNVYDFGFGLRCKASFEPGIDPFVMLRLRGTASFSDENWEKSYRAIKDSPGCCDEVWFSTVLGFAEEETMRDRAERIRQGSRQLKQLGIGSSLQIQMTIGHGDQIARGEEHLYDALTWGRWTGYSGIVDKYCSCPRDPEFLAYIRMMSRIYAETKPRSLWIDDDLRYGNHQPATTKTSPIGCWCERCIADFNSLDGSDWTAKTLLEAMDNNPALSEKWEQFCISSLTEVARIIAEEFTRISPETRFGLQGGRKAESVKVQAAILSTLHEVSGNDCGYRPGGGSYYDDSSAAPQIIKSMGSARFRRLLGEYDWITEWCPEIETFPRVYGSRTPQGILVEGFAALAYGLDKLSLFVMAPEMESDTLYSRRILQPIAEGLPMLRAYAEANKATSPVGFAAKASCDSLYLFGCMAIPVLPGPGKELGMLGVEDLDKAKLTKESSSQVQQLREFYDRRGKSPLVCCSPFVGLVIPRIDALGRLRTLGLLNVRIDSQGPVRLRFPRLPKSVRDVVWYEMKGEPVHLGIEREAGEAYITIPKLGAWNAGFLSFNEQ